MCRRGKYFFCVLLLVLAGFCKPAMRQSFDKIASGFATRFGVREISPEEATRSSHLRFVFVDVRRVEEQSVSIIPGALIASPETDLANWAPLLSELGRHPEKVAIIYCAGGYRSARSIAGARDIGALNLHGGIVGWANAGGALVDKQGTPTNRVHGYNKAWALFVEPPNLGVTDPALD